MEHPRNTQYMISCTTDSVKESGFLKMVVVTLNEDVLAMTESVRVDLADHPLYKQLQTYVLSNPR